MDEHSVCVVSALGARWAVGGADGHGGSVVEHSDGTQGGDKHGGDVECGAG
jgi:hypothetical protein